MLVAASVLQEPANFGPQSPSQSLSLSAVRPSNPRVSQKPGQKPPAGGADFDVLVQQLTAQHHKELQQLQLRLEHAQSENRTFRARASRSAGPEMTGLKSPPGEIDQTNADEWSEFQSVTLGQSAAVQVRSEETEVSEAVPDDRPSTLAETVSLMEANKRNTVDTVHTIHSTRPDLEPASAGEDLAPYQRKPIRLHDVWAKIALSSRSQAAHLGQRLGSHSERSSTIDELTMVGLTQGVMRHVIGNPTSAKRMTWDALGGIMILYDITMLPLMVFDEVDGIFTTTMAWIVMLYWTFNIVNSLTCGYLRNGVAVMSPKDIMIRYFTRTVFVDVLTLVPDWTVAIMQLYAAEGQDFNEARLLRALRAFRLTRLVRIVKLRWLIEVVRDYLDSEYASIMFEISKMMALLLVINHVLACGWFGLSLLSTEIGWRTWTSITDLDYGERWWLYDYLTCLHWSLCQFTPASMEVQPTNPAERGYAALTVLFALIVFSYIVGSITGSLTQLRMMSETITRETLKLRRFLRRNTVPIGLSLRIRRFVEFELRRRQQPVSQASVGCLSVLSEQLQSELGYALVQTTLATHPIFDTLMKSTGGSSLLEKASKGFEKKTLALDDWEFLACTPATHMRYLLAGELRYVRQTGGVLDDPDEDLEIHPGSNLWISEAVLWLSEWDHVGELTATLESNLLLISPDCILPLAAGFPASHKQLKSYAHDFFSFFRQLSLDDMTDVLDPDIMNQFTQRQSRRKMSVQRVR